jgi:acetylornithine/N-succinyldiaminopimelate aminotransferase
VPALNIGDMEIDEFIELFAAALQTVEHAVLLDVDVDVDVDSVDVDVDSEVPA